MILIKCLKTFASFPDVDEKQSNSLKKKSAETATIMKQRRLSNDIQTFPSVLQAIFFSRLCPTVVPPEVSFRIIEVYITSERVYRFPIKLADLSWDLLSALSSLPVSRELFLLSIAEKKVPSYTAVPFVTAPVINPTFSLRPPAFEILSRWPRPWFLLVATVLGIFLVLFRQVRSKRTS